MLRFSPVRCFLIVAFAWMSLAFGSLPVQAAGVDNYVTQYLKATAPVPLALDEQGHTQEFSPEDLSAGKTLFEENCKNCHVGGATLPNPLVSLSLKDLQGALPARDNIMGLVAYLRQPMTYDGSEESFWCRQVSDDWMSDAQLKNLSAFVLRAAEKARGWGTNSF